MRTFQKCLALFIGVSAVIGAAMMWMDPLGESWGAAPLLDMLRAKMPWPDIFFRDFIPSGFVLLIVNGFTQFTTACLLFKNHRLASSSVLASGIILMLWIVLEWWVWGFNAISNIYFVLGLLETISVLFGFIRCRRTSHHCEPCGWTAWWWC